MSEIKVADDYQGELAASSPCIIQLADSRDHKVRQLGLFCGRQLPVDDSGNLSCELAEGGEATFVGMD